MDRNKELEVVTSAYFLEKSIANLEKEKSSLYLQEPEKPEEPRKITVTLGTPQYPTINTTSVEYPKHWKLVSLLGLAIVFLGFLVMFGGSDALFMLGTMIMWPGGIALAVYSLIRGNREKKHVTEEYIERVKNSPEYINKCRQIDEESKIEYEKLKEKTHNAYISNLDTYNKSLKEYNEFLLPQWTEDINALQTTLNDTNNALDELYNTNIIPDPYRNLPALTYLSTFLSTSNYDLKYAIERYDTNVHQRTLEKQGDRLAAIEEIEREIQGNLQYANWLNEQMIEITSQGNETLKSISNWQKADIAMRTYERIKERKNAKR